MLASAGAATALAAVTVAAAASNGGSLVVPVAAGWWVVAAAIGLTAGRGTSANPGIRRLLAEARQATSLPEQRPAALLLNRLWPLFVLSLVPGALAFLAPQIPGIAAGFFIAGALMWRHQESAVSAIEDRDGVTFFIERTSPMKPIRLVRTPGLRRDAAPAPGGGTV